MEYAIHSIEKGSGEGSTYYRVKDDYPHAIYKDRIATITRQQKPYIISNDAESDLDIIVYQMHDDKGVLLCEIEANSSLTIHYAKPY